MKYINIKQIVKLSQAEVDWLETNVFPAKIADIKRPDLERGLLLYYLAKKYEAKRCLDIGTAGFFSARCMAYSGAIVDTIDIKAKDQKYDNINFYEGKSSAIVPVLKEKYDLCFIDGDHGFEGVVTDIRNCKKICKRIVCHDYGNLPEVTKAIDQELKPDQVILDDRMWYNAPYENGYDKNNRKIDYGLVVWPSV